MLLHNEDEYNIDELNQTLQARLLELKELDIGLSLCHPDFAPISINFLSEQFHYRTSHGALGEMVAKACGAKHKPKILDLTAGLGRDSFLLASTGCSVLMLERDPIMHALLSDGLKRLKQSQPNIDLDLKLVDSQVYLQNNLIIADVIYIDPMHPSRSKSALVKKEMRILRDLVGGDDDKQNLIELAFNSLVKRVVIKWPLKAKSYNSKKPTASFKGKSTRFDIFQLR